MNQLITDVLPTTIQNYWQLYSANIAFTILKILLAIIIFLTIKHFIYKLFNSNYRLKIIPKNKNISFQRINTLSKVLKNALIYTLYFFLIYTILSILGFPVGTLIASAGIASVALGLGAKEFVIDVINGFFIISEGQFDVGDIIELPKSNISGRVKEMGIRSTTLVSFTGQTYFIPNSEISIVNNLSREQISFTVEIPIDIKENVATTIETIKAETQHIYQEFQAVVLAEPTLLGVSKTPLQQFNYLVHFTVVNGEQARLMAVFYEKYILALSRQKRVEDCE